MKDPMGIPSKFETEVQAALGVPEADPAFLQRLRRQVTQTRTTHSTSIRPFFANPAWVIGTVAFLLLAGALAAIGPQRVLAAFRQLFGYIPGVGIVDTSEPIRVLAEPVTIIREGISITVTSATLTGDQTHIEYRIFGVPGSAYPDREDVIGCIEQPYLLLDDGSRLETDAPVPANVNEVTYVMPCILDTLPGTAPTSWELPLKFVAAPPGFTVMPVTELSLSPETKPEQNTVVLNESSTTTPAIPEDHAVTVSKEIETEDGYILVGLFQPLAKAGERIQTTGTALADASGKEIPYTMPQDITPDLPDPNGSGSGWAMQFKGYGLAYPLTITFTGVPVFESDPNATAEFTFDAGPNPQPGQEWVLDQAIQLAGHTLNVVSVSADSRNGYAFRIHGDKVYSVGVEIAGFAATGGGGGFSPEGMDSVSVSYAQMPSGELTVILSHLTVTGDPLTWQNSMDTRQPPHQLPHPVARRVPGCQLPGQPRPAPA